MFVFSSKIQSHRCTLESSSTRKNKWEQHWLKNNEICLFIIFVRVRDVVEKIQKYLMIFGARRFEFRLKSDQWTSIFLQRFPRLLRQHRWPEKEKKSSKLFWLFATLIWRIIFTWKFFGYYLMKSKRLKQTLQFNRKF